VARARSRWRACLFRIRFLDPSAFRLFESAVHGFSQVRQIPGFVATEFDNRDGR
jgi:hypothetical protein